ncbi:MAG: GtrA family protein [Candidatus Cloacimonetes bacterium]|nr:GtrA family protein [Candidatus Cloacimonadota bacterium]
MSIKAFMRFIGVGGFVTLLSMLLLYVCLQVFHTPLQLTYILTYLVTVFLSYTLNRLFTFQSSYSHGTMLRYFMVYISGMLLGMLLLYIFRKVFTFPNWVISYMVIPFTLLNNYFWSVKVFHTKEEKQ